jgi:hypothetical protein
MGNKLFSKPCQEGAVLLLFALILLIGSAYTLVVNLNSDTNFYTRQSKETQESLRLAKQALIAYALNFPEIDATSGTDKINGPGYLPCPDINNNGSAGGTCSFSGTNTTIGRLPYKGLEVSDLRDSSGARLWYALSDNYRNSAGLEPLNSETPGQLTVDGNSDIVAVIIAPGAPIGNQNRDPSDTTIATEIANYLETENNDLDLSFISIDPSSTDFTDFNDRLISITRQELMEQVEKRVLGEAKTALAAYKSTAGAYPWLSPFADPKAVARRVSGRHNAASSTTILTDSDYDFTVRGVAIGDDVYNITDGSIGTVSSVTATTLGFTGLTFGTDNDFDLNDEYVVISKATSVTLTGTATAGGDNNTLADNSRDLTKLGVSVSDVVENFTDTSTAIITAVSTNAIEVDGLAGGTDNLFQTNDVYLIRSNYGVATNAAQSATQLDDSNKNFVTMGVQVGDTIRNLTDDSIGTITTVNATSLVVDQLDFGTNNVFSVGDRYTLSRFNAVSGTREGHLSLHEVGEIFSTSFDLDWNVTVLNAGDIVFDTATFANVEVAYRMAELYLQNYALAGSESIDDVNGFCIWSVADIADCYGYFLDYLSIDGRLTSGNNDDRIYDTAATLTTNNIKRGDIVQNYDDEVTVISGTADAGSSGGTLVDVANDLSSLIPYSYMIHNNTQGARALLENVVDADTLETVDYIGSLSTAINFSTGDSYTVYAPRNAVVDYLVSQTELDTDQYTAYNPDFDNNEYYRVVPAANSFSGTVDDEFEVGEGGLGADLTGSEVKLEDTSANFISEGITIGDVIYVPERGDYYGEITAFTATTITTQLYGGGSHTKHFHDADDYTIFHDYVYSREHVFHTKFSGNQATNAVSQERVRDVCIGYNAACTTTTGAVNFSGNGGVPFIRIRDYEADGTTEVGQADFTPSNLSSGDLKISNIDFYLNEVTGDIPSWFINNDWHKLIYVAYSAGDTPGAAAACVAGTDCLTLTGAGTPSNNKNAIVVAAGMEINTILDTNCNNIVSTAQNRTNGTINEYYELGNCNAGDDNFQKQFTTNTFNDQARVVEP